MSLEKNKRNQKIFNEYLETQKSLSQIARKHQLSKERVSQIVEEMLKEFLSKKLTLKERESLKNKGVSLREKGSLLLSKIIFEKILEWDKENQNLRGFVDVSGHLRIVYTLLARKASKKSIKKEYLSKAEKILGNALKISNNLKDYNNSILLVHYAGVFESLAELLPKKERKNFYKKALRNLKKALKNLPGSEAHNAWPLGKIAFLYYKLKEYDKAYKFATRAENFIYEGYLDEFKGEDDSLIKFNVWLPKIILIKALVCKQTKRTLLSKYYAESILAMKGPSYLLQQAKKEAKNLLKD